MFKFATATILASYAQSISLSLQSEAACDECLTEAEWAAKISELADAINDLNTKEPLEEGEILLPPILAFYKAKNHYTNTEYKRWLTPAESQALSDITNYFSTRVNYNKKNADPIAETAKKYYTLAKTKEVDDYLLGTVAEITAIALQ